MDHPRSVSGGHGVEDLASDVAAPLEGQGTLGPEELPQGVPLEQGHDQIVRAVLGDAEVEDLADVVMADVGGRLGLSLETAPQDLFAGALGREALDGHFPVRLEMDGPEHLPHRPAADHIDQLVLALVDHAPTRHYHPPELE